VETIRAQSDRPLDARTFEQLLTEQHPFDQPGPRLDLSDISFISPAGLVQLSALCHALFDADRPATIHIPSLSVRSYASRAGLITVLKDIALVTPQMGGLYNGDELRRGTNPLLVELTRFENSAALPTILDRIVDVLLWELGYSQREAFNVATAVSEVAQSALQHAGGVCAYGAMQVYRSGARPFLEFAIADHGVGLLQSLRRNREHGDLADDASAIRRALEPGASGLDDATHGTGLYHLGEIALTYEGTIQIRTGSAAAYYRGDLKRGWMRTGAHMPGVQITLKLNRPHRERGAV
jgi:anti-sigma regulatory factor (Ser/Thr protein kinase)